MLSTFQLGLVFGAGLTFQRKRRGLLGGPGSQKTKLSVPVSVATLLVNLPSYTWFNHSHECQFVLAFRSPSSTVPVPNPIGACSHSQPRPRVHHNHRCQFVR